MNTYSEILHSLVSFLARGGHSQARIAQKLNERELFTPDENKRWNQTAVARYMAAERIIPGNKAAVVPRKINYHV